jgi:hypothetical protein
MVDLPPEEIADAIRESLNAPQPRIVGSVSGTVVELYPTRIDRRFYSPRLSVVLYPRQKTLVVGRYGPDPDTWTFMVAAYALCAFVIFAGVIGSAAEYLAGMPVRAWLGVPVGLLGGCTLFGSAMIGRYLAREQVAELEAFFLRSLPGEAAEDGGGAREE